MVQDLRGHAALVLLSNPDGRVLAISRGENVRDWGFPGGTSEPGVDLVVADTAFRELHEETGVVAAEITVVVSAVRSGTHMVTTFVATKVVHWPEVLRSEPFEGHVAWVDPGLLVAPTCRYRNHARKVLEKVGIL